MIVSALAFYLFAAVLLLSAVMVIAVRNPVHSVLFLILAFFNAAGLFVLLGAEFIAMVLVIVYVGAVAVLFLFVVMMLDISFAHLRKGAMQYVPIGVVLGGVLLAELVILYKAWEFADTAAINIASPAPGTQAGDPTNTESLGRLIYTDYIFAFQGAGLILLVAMVGAIVLTLRQRPDVRRQDIAKQTSTHKEDVLDVRKINTGSGL